MALHRELRGGEGRRKPYLNPRWERRWPELIAGELSGGQVILALIPFEKVVGQRRNSSPA